MAAPCIFIHGLAILLLLLQPALQETILGEETEDFDFDGLPGSTHEFKVDVLAGATECFYQKISKGAQLHISFEVLRGADRNIDIIVKDPHGELLDSHLWVSTGTVQKDIEIEGAYEICVDNSFSRFASKLVYIYLITYVQSDWQRFSDDIQALGVELDIFTNSLKQVDKSIQEMTKFQAMGRQTVVLDHYLITSNNSYVQNLSLTLIATVMITGAIQLYFVKKLFNVKSVTPTDKPRA